MEPTVCAVMLTRDRPELAKRAVECFRAQTYPNKRLYIFDTGRGLGAVDALPDGYQEFNIVYHRGLTESDMAIGGLRNRANWWAVRPTAMSEPDGDVLIHWDDDDWSHPNRIAEQVALLQASGADVVGYNEMLFWRTLPGLFVGRGEAWLYSNPKPPAYALGTSLCYWRKTWERHHFPNETQGVEDHWLREKNVVAMSSLGVPLFSCEAIPTGESAGYETFRPGPVQYRTGGDEPRMIARIHGGNTSNGYKLEEYVEKGSKEWKRVPEWDAAVRGILA